MIDDPYLSRLGMQLVHCPPSSAEALNLAANGKAPAQDPGAAIALISGKSWVKAVMSRLYTYPDDTLFVPIRQENGRYDVIRASYNVHAQQVEIAQSLHVIAVTLRGVTSSSPHNAAWAREMARRFLQVPENIRFEEVGEYEAGRWGRRPQPPGAPGWPNWVDEIRWWSSGSDIGFLTLKAAGGPTQALISPGEGLNLHWFD